MPIAISGTDEMRARGGHFSAIPRYYGTIKVVYPVR